MGRKLKPGDPSDSLTDGSMVAFGENPGGFTVITPNGVGHDFGPGANHQYNYSPPGHNGPRWEMPRDETTIIYGESVTGQAASGPTVRSGSRRKNRTGE